MKLWHLEEGAVLEKFGDKGIHHQIGALNIFQKGPGRIGPIFLSEKTSEGLDLHLKNQEGGYSITIERSCIKDTSLKSPPAVSGGLTCGLRGVI